MSAPRKIASDSPGELNLPRQYAGAFITSNRAAMRTFNVGKLENAEKTATENLKFELSNSRTKAYRRLLPASPAAPLQIQSGHAGLVIVPAMPEPHLRHRARFNWNTNTRPWRFIRSLPNSRLPRCRSQTTWSEMETAALSLVFLA